MGLDTTHDCWHSGYGHFMVFRRKLATLAGLPDLLSMDGYTYTSEGKVHSWEPYENDPIVVLLNHSDCSGVIKHKDCYPLACRLEQILEQHPNMKIHDPRFVDRVNQFAKGLRLAHNNKEDVEFH